LVQVDTVAFLNYSGFRMSEVLRNPVSLRNRVSEA
jgi:hypothetical protein